MVGALLRSSHPVPAIGVTLVAILLGIAVGLEPWRVAVLGTVFALNQFSVGLSNDWIDADRDRAAGRSDKPVALGQVPVALVRGVAIAMAVASAIIALPLGLPAAGVHLVVLISAWSYNAGLKNSVLSAVPYLVSFGLLPLVATLARPDPALAAWWAMAVGGLLGIAAHIANVLPDLDDDRRTGIRGLPHRLGPRLATVVAATSLAGAAAALAIGTGLGTMPAVIGFALSLAVSAAAVGFGLIRPGSRVAFRLIIVAALVDVSLLILAGERLLG